MRPYSISFLLLLLSIFSLSQNIHAQKYQAGYRELQLTDSARLYKPGAPIGHPLYYRPVALDIWYPAANTGKERPVPYQYFLQLLERRANSFQDSTRYDGIAAEMEKHFSAANLNGKRAVISSATYASLPGVDGKFPLIVYLSAMNGMSYENVSLFELLAANGYIVVSISSIGRYPGDMTMAPADINEQVVDARFAIKRIREKYPVDSSGIGLLGYSLGGLAARQLAAGDGSVTSILSLDGSELHYYGLNQTEDDDFNEWRKKLMARPVASNGHYAYLASDKKDISADSTFPSSLLPAAHQYYLQLYNTTHEDFSTLSFYQSKEDRSHYSKICGLTLAFFQQYLQKKGNPFTEQVAEMVQGKEGHNQLASPAGVNPVKQMLSGRIVAASTGNAIPYVSVLSTGAERGTVANAKGVFQFDMAGMAETDSIVISSLGYASRIFNVRQLREALLANSEISMERKNQSLQEVVVVAKNRSSKIRGNTSQSKFISVGFPLRDLGSEVGVRLSLGKQKMLLKSFNYTVSHLRMDSALFRLNIYTWENGKPGANVLTQNILTGFDSTGTYSINLLPYKIILSGPLLVSLEWIDGHTSTGQGNVFFSAGFLSSGYRRKTTSSKWIRSAGLAAGFNVSVVAQQ